MIKLFLITVFLIFGNNAFLYAADVPAEDQEFTNEVGSLKSPFDNGLPKPVIVSKSKNLDNAKHKKKVVKPKIKKPVVLPVLHLQGVIVGDSVHEAIIDDQVVPLLGIVQGAQIRSVSKEGVGLFFQGKKFFLKVE